MPSQGMASAGQVVAVHPGALAPDVWRPLLEWLPAGVEATLVDLQRERGFVLAALADPSSGSLRAGPERPSVDSLARVVAEAISRAHPAVLVGWSFGGVVAQAALAHTDHRPQALVLLDSIAPVPSFTIQGDLDETMCTNWFAMYICAKQAQPLPEEIPPTGSLPALLEWCIRAGALRDDTSLAGFTKVYEAYVGGLVRNNSLVQNHRARPHTVPTVLVKPTRSLLPDRGDLGWHELAVNLEIVPCGGDHYSLFGDNLVARLLSGLLTDPPPNTASPADSARTVPTLATSSIQ